MKNELVSVIMPVYNTEKYVFEAISSVLSQTYNNLELICINDGSTDGTSTILKSFSGRLVLVEGPNEGAAVARNKGIGLAKGSFLAFIDADDVWEKNKLELQLSHINKNPDKDIIFTNMKCFISPELSAETKKIKYCPPNIIPGYILSSFIILKSSFHKVGYFNSEFKNGEFVDWLVRAQQIGFKIGLVDEVLLRRRIHETNVGVINRLGGHGEYLKIVRENLKNKNKN